MKQKVEDFIKKIKEKNMKQKIGMIVLALFFVGLGSMTTWLFYNQAIGKFNSDLILHISSAISSSGSQYTITKPIYKFIYMYFGGNLGIAVFLSIVVILTIILTKKLLDYYTATPKESSTKNWIYAFLLNFAIAIFIPFIHKGWNAGVQEANEWHNSTYICMKLLGLGIMLLYFKMSKKYLSKIETKDYILFVILLLLVNLIKPNFIIAFAPAMLVYLIIDFFKNIKNKKAIINIIIFGCAVLISLSVLVYQAKVLYGVDDGSGIKIGFMTLLKAYHEYPVISLIQSIAFPLFILVINIKKIAKDRKYSFVWIMNTVALLEYLCLEETGARALDGNFDWGYSFTLMMTFISSVALFENTKNDKTKIYTALGYLLLALHIASGIAYFARLMLGYTFA